MADAPTGAATFLFTDIEGSTRAWETDPRGTASALEIHDRILRDAIERNGGYVFATGGDSFSAAFSSPSSALTAATEAQRGMIESASGLSVRMGVHSGEAIERDGNYFGPPLNQTARLMSIGHGGQVLVSDITRGLVTAAAFEFMDLGEHRLADLSTPMRLAQLAADGLPVSFPALRSAVAVDNLPPLGEVFGRSTDVDRLSELLVERRLVTLTGAGGIGKTTLATLVAGRLIDPFPDGRWLIDLTDLPTGSDQAAIAGVVAAVDERFVSIEALTPRRLLIILDNCEHVLDAARGYVNDVLASAPEVKVLATSRELLGARGEKTVPVAPLLVDEDSEHASAVDLFIERAGEAGVRLDLQADRHTINSICREVGGLPLAIELAAARTAVMTPGQVLAHLSDRLTTLKGGRTGPEHHRTIEATIAWSYDLLEQDTQYLLRFLSVFEGGFDLNQAEVAGGRTALETLADLTRKSLLNRKGERFVMLEAVRQYATIRLQEADEEAEARWRHFNHFADRAHDIYNRGEYIEIDEAERTWITTNLANLHAAVAWGAEHGAAVRAAQTAEVLWIHLVTVLYGRQQPNWYEQLLIHLDDLPPRLQLSVLHGAGVVADWLFDDVDRAVELMDAAYRIHVQTGLLPASGAAPHNGLGMAALKQGRWVEALEWFESGAAVGPARSVAAGNWAFTLWNSSDDVETALSILDASRSDLAETPRHWQHANLDLLEARIRMSLGEIDRPRHLILSSLRELREAEVRYDLQYGCLSMLSTLERSEGRLDACATFLLEALDLAASHALDLIWTEPDEVVDLADALIDLSHAEVASELLAFFHRLNTSALAHRDVRELDGLRRRLEHATNARAAAADTRSHRYLIDAIRTALSNPSSVSRA